MSIWKDGAYYPLGCGEEQSMGEYEEEYALCQNAGLDEDAIYESSALHPLEEPPPPPPYGLWRVRGGALLKIREMTDEHLRNAIALFTRNGRGGEPKIKELREELRGRS